MGKDIQERFKENIVIQKNIINIIKRRNEEY
jgi:hypothetical protein